MYASMAPSVWCVEMSNQIAWSWSPGLFMRSSKLWYDVEGTSSHFIVTCMKEVQKLQRVAGLILNVRQPVLQKNVTYLLVSLVNTHPHTVTKCVDMNKMVDLI
jgi:hypothetical protein